MQRNEFAEAEQYTKRNTFRRIWRQFVRVMACIVVFCTTYALILPAITLIKSTTCNLEEHTHTESCYTKILASAYTENTCTYQTLGVHVHQAECYDAQGAAVCGTSDFVVHSHDDSCQAEDGTIACQLPEIQVHSHNEACYDTVETETAVSVHAHTDACYTLVQGDLICQLTEGEGHVHADACYVPGEAMVCGQEESESHTHTDACYESVLNCGKEETEPHWHSDACYAHDLVTTCGLETGETVTEVLGTDSDLVCGKAVIVLHTHEDACYATVTDETGTERQSLICAQSAVTEHIHSDACFTTTEIPMENVDTLTCGQEETAGHAHDDTCLDESGAVACGQEEIPAHTHSALCYGTWELTCALEEHVHTEECAPGLTEEQQTQVDAVIAAIDAIPSADEIDAKIAEFEAAEDYDGEEAWLTEIYAEVRAAYSSYAALTEELQGCVTNADKLLELEYIWSAEELVNDSRFWSTPTVIEDYAHTSEFIQLNLYDYGSEINDRYNTSRRWPGFQWNGGAYMAGDTFNRYKVDFIDFGNSLITDFKYGSSSSGTNGKSSNAIAVGKILGTDSASTTGSINRLWQGSTSASLTNRPIGMSLNSSYTVDTYTVMKPILSGKGYPVLMDSELEATTSFAKIDGVLDWLFTDDPTVEPDSRADKLNDASFNHASIDGLFQIDSVTGAYYYDSRLNHAEYLRGENRFVLYEEAITPNFIVYPFGNFLPLNTIADYRQATDISMVTAGMLDDYLGGTISSVSSSTESSREQLENMLGRYRTSLGATASGSYWTTWSAYDAIKDYFTGTTGLSANDVNMNGIKNRIKDGLYNIDFDVETNFFFGMDMTMNLMMPKDGKTGNDNNGDGVPDYDMKFTFSGDDDVWVYIDGNLFLDLSGIHRHVGGEIDFVNGTIKYYELDVTNGGDVSTEPYKTYTFEQVIRKALAWRNRTANNGAGLTEAEMQAKVKELIDPETNTFYEYSTHVFKFFYIERGSGSSVCRINFNFPLLRKNSITVTKEAPPDDSTVQMLGNPDYYFNILDRTDHTLLIGPNSITKIDTFKILDSDGNVIGTGKTDEYGIFTLKAGQTALFEGIPENTGEYYVQELIKNDDNEQYVGNVEINGAKNSDVVDWSTRDWFWKVKYPDGYVSTGDEAADKKARETGPYGFIWHYYSSAYVDISNSRSMHFDVKNGIITSRLGKLCVTKNVIGPDGTTLVTDGKKFRIYVELDGEPLPAGTPYTVGDETRYVAEDDAGYIELASGETATIRNIISGTKFLVKEDPDSAKGYKVEYKMGELHSTYYTEFTGDSITSPIFVNLTGHALITNSENGASVQIPLTKAFTNFAGTSYDYTFVLKEADEYGNVKDGGVTKEETGTFTATEQTFTFSALNYLKHNYDSFPATAYYLIYEKGETATSLDNTQAFLVEVTISEDEDSTAAVKPITAAVTSVSEGTLSADGTVSGLTERSTTDITFTNTLTGGLTVTKEVIQGSSHHHGLDFPFTLTLESGESGANVPSQILVDGTAVDAVDGVFSFTLKHGGTAVLTGLPVGAKWTLTEGDTANDADSYDTVITLGEEKLTGTVAEGTVGLGTVTVAYQNTVRYRLPETGGAGTTPYTMAGLVLITVSAAYLLYRPKARRREAE